MAINNDDYYSDLESFFIEVVGVKMVTFETFETLYARLSDPNVNLTLDELRSGLLEFSTQLPDMPSKYLFTLGSYALKNAFKL